MTPYDVRSQDQQGCLEGWSTRRSGEIPESWRLRLDNLLGTTDWFDELYKKPRVLSNSSNCPLYLLCFGAGNEKGAPIALRIADHLLTKGAE